MSKAKQLTTTEAKFDPNRVSVSEIVDGYRKGTKQGYVNYNHPSLGENTSLMLQTDWIEMNGGGIPKPNPDFFKGDKDRAFVNIPISKTSSLFKKMMVLQKEFTSDEFKQEHFGKHWSKYTMYPLVKVPETEDDEESEYPPTMKVKFELEWNDEDEDACVIKSQVFTSTVDEDGKRTRTSYDKHSLADMESLIRYGSKIRPIIRPVKMWVSAKKEYGVIWRFAKVEVEPKSGGNALMKAFYDEDAFLDSDEDEETVEATKSSGGAGAGSESDSDEDSEVKPPPLPKASKKEKKKMVMSDSDDDSDDDSEEEAPVKAKASKKTVEISDSDDSDSDSDSPVVPVRKSKGKKGKSKSKNL